MKHVPLPEGPNPMSKNLVFKSSDREITAEIDHDGDLIITTTSGCRDWMCIDSEDLPGLLRLFEPNDLPEIPPGFMRWHGGKRPFRKGVFVDVVFRDGILSECEDCQDLKWERSLIAPTDDIIACKISEDA